jgi:hypothetical protein
VLALDHERARLQADRGTGGERRQTNPRGCHQNHNVTISASRPKSTKALGLNMAARISEVGLNAPQVGQRITPGHTVAAQRLQTSLGKKQTPI